MQTTKHTPGPWTISEDNELVIGGYSTGAGPADFSNGVQDYPEAMANMTLAAAAPELLALLKAMVAQTKSPTSKVDPLTLTRDMAIAAIAKAEGVR